MNFEIDVGVASSSACHGSAKDLAGVGRLKPAAGGSSRCWLVALADGSSGTAGGSVAAQIAMQGLVQDFEAAPGPVSGGVGEAVWCLDRLLQAQNARLTDLNQRVAPSSRSAASMTAVLVHGGRYVLSHVGVCRAWLVRGGSCQPLTLDHRLPRSELEGPARALGLDPVLRLDHSQGELQDGDRLLLTTLGVHGPLGPRELVRGLQAGLRAQQAAQALLEAARLADDGGEAMVVVLEARGQATLSLEEQLRQADLLPGPARWEVGDQQDGYRVLACLADDEESCLVQARDEETGDLVVLKAVPPSAVRASMAKAQLARELWLAERLVQAARGRRGAARGYDAALVRVLRPRQPSAFYGVFEWHGGRTLEQLLASGPLPADVIRQMALAIAGALSLIHASGCVHGAVQPKNLQLGEDGAWRLLDLGEARVLTPPRRPSSPKPSAAPGPGQAAEEDGQIDLRALGASMWSGLTGQILQRLPLRRGPAGRGGEPGVVSRWAPQTPDWLVQVVDRLIAQDASMNFESADELLLALERGADGVTPVPRALPLLQRVRRRSWRVILGLCVLVNLMLLLWLLWLPTP